MFCNAFFSTSFSFTLVSPSASSLHCRRGSFVKFGIWSVTGEAGEVQGREARGRRVLLWVRKKEQGEMCDGCRPLGFLLGLPFMLIALVLSVIGILLWVITAPLACCCPCLICFTAIAELGISLVKAPVNVMRWFTRQIPC